MAPGEENAVRDRAAGAAIRAHAVLLGERIDARGFEAEQVAAAAPLGLRVGREGLAMVFRYGAVVFVAADPAEEAAFIERLKPRIVSPITPAEEETALIRAAPAAEDSITPAGVIQLREHSPERLSVIADVLAKSVALAHHEREVAGVFDSIEPISRALMGGAAPAATRKSFLELIGSALMAQHRVSGRVAVREKPDILWDRPDLERLYGRLESEYELTERTETLARKLQVVGATATAMIDLQDTARSHRLEVLVVVLILVEVALSLVQMYLSWKGLGAG
jgi:required for meiotic nuclear division protein 1